MRMFLIAMCDVFLILYLTGAANVQSKAVLTVDDFYELKTMHDALREKQQQSKSEFEEQLRKMQEAKANETSQLEDQLRQMMKDKEALIEEKTKKEVLATIKMQALAQQKEMLKSKLEQEKERFEQTKESLEKTKEQQEQITKSLQETEQVLKSREEALAKLNDEVYVHEQERRRVEAQRQKELQKHKQAVQMSQQLVSEMQQKANLAVMAAKEAQNVKVMAVQLKDEALKAKEEAEQKAVEALAASYRSEVEKRKAIEEMEKAKENRIQAEENARRLARTIEDITQNVDVAYAENVRPKLQKVNVDYRKRVGDEYMLYERELTLVPVTVDGHVYVVFPSKQIGFRQRSDSPPNELNIMFKEQQITNGLINKDDDLIAVMLPGYEKKIDKPYPLTTTLEELMPSLLSVRNNGNVSIFDKLRGIADDYFIVNREYLAEDNNRRIEYAVKGFRGTGTYGERIVRGDQLVDLNGKLIGVAADADQIIRINNLTEWTRIEF